MMFFGGGGGAGAGMAANSGASSSTNNNNSNNTSTPSSSPEVDLSSLLPEGWDTNHGPLVKAAGTLLHNPFFSAGAGLWLLTLGGTLGRQCMLMAKAYLQRRLVVSMEMTNLDASYEVMLRWLSTNPRFKVQHMSVLTRNLRIYANDMRNSECLYGPCPNVRHWFLYGGRPLTLSRRRNEAQAYGGEVLETLQFTTIGLNSTILERLMQEAQQFASDQDSDRTVVYLSAGGRWSRQQDPRPRRPFTSVILADGMGEGLMADVRQFLDSGAYYRSIGVPYRRGYLLHGPPGCGKTSFVMALAGELRLSICLLSLSNRGLTDEVLMTLLNSSEMHSIILMEDIDRAFSADSNVTMSGLLNALDGVGAQEGRLVFMTTNHVERLDAALIRPGRADVKVEVGLLDGHQARRMFAKFYPSASAQDATTFSDMISPNTVSVAQIQSHLFFHRDQPAEAIAALPAFLDSLQRFDAQMRERKEKAALQMEVMQKMPRVPIL